MANLRIKKNKFRPNNHKKLKIGIIVILTITLLIAIFFITSLYKLTPVLRVQKIVQNIIPKACIHPLQRTIDTTPEFSKSDCNFSSGYPKFIISELDRLSCTRISRYFVIDENHVYKQQYDPGSSDRSSYLIIKEADPTTFEYIGGDDYYKDRYNIYYDTGLGYRIIKNINLKSVEVLSSHYIKDQNNLYFYETYMGLEAKSLTGFDVTTFKVLDKTEKYFKDKNGVYYSEGLGDLDAQSSKIDPSDPNTFEVLDYEIAKDKDYVYQKRFTIEGTDSKSFEVMNPGSMFKDKNNVYANIGGVVTKLSGIDGCTYELIDYTDHINWSGYSKDKDHVYYYSIVDGADPDTFQIGSENYTQGVNTGFDKNHRYQGRNRID